MPDDISSTEARFQALTEQRMPTPIGGPLEQAVRESRAMGISGDMRQSALMDQAIDARRQFEQRRQQLINQLPYAHKGQARAIGEELRQMDFEERQQAADQRFQERSRQQEAHERRLMAHQGVEENLQLAKVDRETDIDEHGSVLMQTLPQLRSMLRNGQMSKDQYDSALLDTLGRYGALGMHHPGVSQLVNHYLEEADKQNAFQQRRDISEVTKMAGKYGIEPQVDPSTGLPSIELTKQAALQTDRGRGEALASMNKEMVEKYGLGTGVSSLFNPVAPHGSPDKGKTIDIPFIDRKKGTIAKVNVPMPLFNQMKADFQDRYFAVVPQTQPTSPQGPTATDPRTALAQRALNDPNATEAHKAAARQILGLQ